MNKCAHLIQPYWQLETVLLFQLHLVDGFALNLYKTQMTKHELLLPRSLGRKSHM